MNVPPQRIRIYPRVYHSLFWVGEDEVWCTYLGREPFDLGDGGFLLWTTGKTRAKEKTYKWVSVEWKTQVKLMDPNDSDTGPFCEAIINQARDEQKTSKSFVVYYNGESESYREEMRWCRCYKGQRVEVWRCQGPSHLRIITCRCDERLKNLKGSSRFFCLLWINNAKAKQKTYTWVSVWWKTKR